MIDDHREPLHGVVRPFACYAQGWRLIRDDYWRFFGIVLLASLIGYAIPFGFLLGPMWCGIEIYLLRRMAGQRATLGNLFEGFDYFVPSMAPGVIITTLLTAAVVIVWLAYFAGTIGMLIHQGFPDETFLVTYGALTVLYMVGMVLSCVVASAPGVFVFALVVDRRLSGWAALSTTMRAIVANFWGIVGLLILDTLVSGAGTMLCCVGLYFLYPISMAAGAVAYRQVFPRHTYAEDEDDEPVPQEPARPIAAPGPPSTDIRSDAPPKPPPETGITAGPAGD